MCVCVLLREKESLTVGHDHEINIITTHTHTHQPNQNLTVNDSLDAPLHLLVNVDLRAAGSKDVVVAVYVCVFMYKI